MTQFETLVIAMREAQKQYVKTTSPMWFDEKKKLEAKVDAHLERLRLGQLESA